MAFKLRVCLTVLLLFAVSGTILAQAQQAYLDTVIKHAKWYDQKLSQPLLFAHIDKTIYVNNETIWFAVYLLNPGKSLAGHQVISASLVNNNTQQVVAEAKFPMRGFAHGKLTVPDTLSPGNYSFITFTNVMANGKPIARFVQPITIKTSTQPPFTVNLTLDTLYKNPDNTRVMLTASSTAGPLDGAAIEYFLGKNKGTRLVGKAKTNVLGSVTLLIPKNRINNEQHNLEVQVKSNKLVKTLHLDIPVKKQSNDVKFYPESGYMVSGMMGKVSWEVKTPGGTPIKAKAQVYADTKVVDTIETDSYGMGSFYINPASNKTYTAKLLHVKNDDVIYSLPRVLPAGLAMHVENAVVNDTLKVTLKSSFAGKFTLLVHDYKQIFSVKQLDVDKKGYSIKIVLENIPRGLNTVTVLDGLQRPLAERLFFAHYDDKPAIAINVDNREPGLRQKINVKLKINTPKMDSTKALVSVAVVQDNRFDRKKDNNIEHYLYVQSQLDNIPAGGNLMGVTASDRKYLNDLLLLRGWSKYNWQEMMKTSPADTLKTEHRLFFTGDITRMGDSLMVPVNMVLMKDEKFYEAGATDSTGHFRLNNAQVFSSVDKVVRLMVAGGSGMYTIRMTDPYYEMQQKLAMGIEPEIFDPPITEDTKAFIMPDLKPGRNLREVKIKGKGIQYGANACGDYVCRFGLLNCFNHPKEADNRPPKIGETLREAGGAGLIKYAGCGPNIPVKPGMVSFWGIYNAKEYYPADYKLIDPIEPDYLSTLYWTHDLMLNSDNEATLSFYTSDIPGKFRVVVQGVTDQDVVYGEAAFEVVEKKKNTP